MSDRPARVRAAVGRWIHEAVVGLNLCPFAAPVEDRLKIAVSAARDADGALRDALAEAMHLLQTPALPTTLVAFPDALADFETFLDVAAEVEGALSEAGADGVLQIATFHPDYRFAGVPEDDLGNYTNRAPCPVLHLIREADVSAAVARHPDPEGIPDRNVARLEALGAAGVTALFDRFEIAGDARG